MLLLKMKLNFIICIILQLTNFYLSKKKISALFLHADTIDTKLKIKNKRDKKKVK